MRAHVDRLIVVGEESGSVGKADSADGSGCRTLYDERAGCRGVFAEDRR